MLDSSEWHIYIYIGNRLYMSAGWQIGFQSGTATAVSQRLMFATEEWANSWAIQAVAVPWHAMNQGCWHIGCGQHISFVDRERRICVVMPRDLCHQEVNYSFISVMKQLPNGLIKKYSNLTKLRVSFLWKVLLIFGKSASWVHSVQVEKVIKKWKETCRCKQTPQFTTNCESHYSTITGI